MIRTFDEKVRRSVAGGIAIVLVTVALLLAGMSHGPHRSSHGPYRSVNPYTATPNSYGNVESVPSETTTTVNGAQMQNAQTEADKLTRTDGIDREVIYDPTTKTYTVETKGHIYEDDPQWNCRTMGNKICGPDNSNNVPEGDYSDDQTGQ